MFLPHIDKRLSLLKSRRHSPTRAANHRHPFSGLDALESRVLLSVVPAGKTATYHDVDNDIVTITTSVGTFTGANFTTTALGLGDQLNEINLTTGGPFIGANITISVKRALTGDGLANVGFIHAAGIDLGSVTIAGDLGSMDVGSGAAVTPALKLLSTRSLGRVGLSSQGGGGNLAIHVTGILTSLVVKGDMQDAFVEATGANGEIGTASVGGSLIGGSADHSGEIRADVGILSVKVAGDLQGGGGLESGTILGGALGAITVGGSLLGSLGDSSGSVISNSAIGAVTVGGDLRGRSGTFSGAIAAGAGGILSVKVGGSLLGSTGTHSGDIFANLGMGKVSVGRDIDGFSGDTSGAIVALTGGILSVAVGGSLAGNSGASSGSIFAGGNVGTIAIAGDIRGGSGNLSASVTGSGTLAGFTLAGSLQGGNASNAGQVVFTGNIAKVVILHDIRGGSASAAGFLSSGGQILSASIGGSLLGGSAQNTGKIAAQGLGLVKIAHDIRGGSAPNSGMIQALAGNITSLAVGGTIAGGSDNQTGEILSSGDMGALAIGGSLIGAGVTGTSSLDQTGAIICGGRLTSVAIAGSIVSGANLGTGQLTASGTIRSGKDIGSVAVKQNLIGNENSTNSSPVIISAFGNIVAGALTDVALGKIAIGGRVELANILAGWDTALQPGNADAQIGTVTVGGDWVDSNLVDGAFNTTGPSNFGDANDAKINVGVDNPAITAKIASVTISGFVYGLPLVANGPTHFGFVAESFGSFKIAGIAIPPHAAPHTLLIPSTTDVTIDEL